MSTQFTQTNYKKCAFEIVIYFFLQTKKFIYIYITFCVYVCDCVSDINHKYIKMYIVLLKTTLLNQLFFF